jgi:hypothetical protein
MTSSWEDLIKRPYKRWYQFGLGSPKVLYRRFQSKHYWIGRPIWRTKMSWQRVARGYSDEECWGLDHHLARVIVGGVQNLRKWQTGYPSEFDSWEDWDVILAQIEEGFQAWWDEGGYFHERPDLEAKFTRGMDLLGEWFGALWD